MTKPEPPALWTPAHTLAAAHDAYTLGMALAAWLARRGRWVGAQELVCGGPDEHWCPETFAGNLVARLCVDGRDDLADALVTLLRGGGLPERLRQDGPDDQTLEDWIRALPNPHLLRWLAEIAGPNVHPEPLAHGLVKALREHEEGELADAVAALLKDAVFDHPLLQHPLPPQAKQSGVVETLVLETLVAAHGEDDLASALMLRLCADGCEHMAAKLMDLRVRVATGPVVEAGHLAAALIVKLRAGGFGQLADALAAQMEGAGLARGPRDPAPEEWLGALPSRAMLRWLMAFSYATLGHASALLHAVERRLRLDGNEELATTIGAPLQDAVKELEHKEWLDVHHEEAVASTKGGTP